MPEGDAPHSSDDAPSEPDQPTPTAEATGQPQPAPSGAEPRTEPEPHTEPGPSRRRRLRFVVPVLVGVLALATTSYVAGVDGLADRLGLTEQEPPTPVEIAPPPGLDLPEVDPVGPVVATLPSARVAPAAVQRAVGRLVRDKRFSRHYAVVVAPVGGPAAWRSGAPLVTPASTLKLLTSLAALEAVGPEHRFATTAVQQGRTVTLVGGGDPLLTTRPRTDGGYPAVADLDTLARQVARALQDQQDQQPGGAGRPRVRLAYDTSLFTGPSSSPTWEDDYLSTNVVSPITPLWVDEGRERAGFEQRSADPAAAAARAFATALRRHGVAVAGSPRPGVASSSATRVGVVRSAPLVEVVQHVLEVSDNEGAEVLARHVALATGAPASFTGAARAVEKVLTTLGVDLAGAVLHDGSGLSRQDRLRPRTLLDVLATAADPDRPELGGLLEGLPVAGFSGSLAYRFVALSGPPVEPGLGWVRAKTGTLSGVHGLAGTVVGRDGTPMLFVAVSDRVRDPDVSFVRDRLDQIAAALAACVCGAS